MVSAKAGIDKLIDIYKEGSERTQIFVLSPSKSQELNLDRLIEAAVKRDEKLWSRLEKSQEIWRELAENSIGRLDSESVKESITSIFSQIESILNALWILGESSENIDRHLSGLTSVFLSNILKERFRKEGINAEIMEEGDALSLRELSEGAIFVPYEIKSETFSQDASLKVRSEGEGELLSAEIGALYSAPIVFWNNKSLLCTASRKHVPNARVIRSLSYDEATELSFFGAPIVHPKAFHPAREKNLEIEIRYFGDIKDKGTVISNKSVSSQSDLVKAFSVVDGIALLNVEGPGMSGVPGISSRLFSALKNDGISVIFISQASSEYSICFAVPQSQASSANRAIKREFSKELDDKKIDRVETETDLSILAVVGESMPGRVGVAGKFFSSLARSGVNIRAIAQGSSERNISAVIKTSDSTKALRALHSVFFLSQQTLSIGLFGPGNIGGTLLDQIGRESERLKKEFDLDIRIRGIANSKKMLLSEEGVNLSNWRESFEKYAVLYNEDVFLSHIKASYYPHSVIVDCTSDEKRALGNKDLIKDGFHIVTPNKKASSGPYEYYTELQRTVKETGKRFYYETTVGAGLPIITTLKDLRETGDKIEKIEGMVSGTLSWLFNTYDGTMPFSELVKKAKELGYTEPDPRDDLSGMDVARKTVILARECGYKTEVSDIAVESLVPESLKSLSKEDFLKSLYQMDDKIERLYREAKKRGCVIRYIGKVEDGKCSVSLMEYPEGHPFSSASGTDNVIAFTTKRYHDQPLVIKGPGAGPEVTAGGVFADILRLSAYLGSKI